MEGESNADRKKGDGGRNSVYAGGGIFSNKKYHGGGGVVRFRVWNTCIFLPLYLRIIIELEFRDTSPVSGS